MASDVIELRIENQYCRVLNAPKTILRLLDEATSYAVDGYWFSQAYKDKHWDGRVHLMKQRASGVTFPAGLLDDVKAVLADPDTDWPCKVVDARANATRQEYRWNDDIVMRDYQAEAVESFLAHGFGILKMPIRSGKTKTAARVIWKLQQPTLFIVPSKLLLRQTVQSLQECFPDESIGAIGDGQWNIQRITVVIVASFVSARKTKKALYKKLCERVGLVIFDESHHLSSDGWCEVMMDFLARYRLGLSATPMLDKAKAAGKGVIWLKAACGPIRADVDISEMIRKGHLVAPTFHLYRFQAEEKHKERKWSQGLADDVIFLNPRRNGKIAKLARVWANKGKRVLIITRRVEQVELICAKLGNVGSITGAVASAERESRLADFVSGRVPIMIGTVFGEGVDIPEIDVVIIACGGEDEKQSMQNLRNLTPYPGKTEAIVIDFMDMTHKYFAKHSRARLKVYRSESEFRIKLKG